MPELPEIETIKNELQNIENKRVVQYFRSTKNLRITESLNLKKILNCSIKKISRRGRYILIEIFDDSKHNQNMILIFHLGMSGKITINHNFSKQKHDHFACQFQDKTWLIFNDTRRFGFVDLIYKKDLSNHKILKKLGIEPLSNDFTTKYLCEKLQNKSGNIKSIMMQNDMVTGVGNIYINEALFDCKISPLRKANSLLKSEVEKLIISIKQILQDAINKGGSSISNYIKTNGESGKFQNNFKVYGRNEKLCYRCKVSKIKKIIQLQRSSFYCDVCQK